MAGPTTVEDYFSALSEEQRAVLETVRKTIKTAAPEATEAISYQMPAFKHHGRVFLSYAAFKDHYSLFPASKTVMDAVGDELSPYVTGKATISFTADKPLPESLLKKVVEVRLEETAAGRQG